MKKVFLFSVIFFSFTSAFANRIVIDELRKLKASLPVNDSARGEITLRLADRLAEEYLVGKEKTQIKSESDRTEAIALYQESLASRSGESKIKIQFQMARLHAEKMGDVNEAQAARTLFDQVRLTSQVKELKRESNLRLAEIAESSPKTAGSAIGFYREVLALCEGTDSCSFAHYRLGWIERHADHFPAAINEMKLALWDSKGQIREEALRDLISFMGLAATEADQSIPYVDQLSLKVARPIILQDLAYAYFSSGNKAAGVRVLALTHSRNPTIYGEMRLMEEYYGLRNWDQFRAVLAQFTTSVAALPVASSATAAEPLKDAIEIEKIGRRLATQLDGERTSDASRFEDFKQFTLSYLNLFPRSAERAKIMEGLIAAEPNLELKISQLKTWLNSPQFSLTPADEVRLRELRAAIAQKIVDKDPAVNSVVIEEMTALIAKGGVKVREYKYVRARANYAQKNYSAAAPEFTDLAIAQTNPDSYAIQSQHLLLDIYNQQKEIGKLIAQAKVWTENETLKKDLKLATDLQEMSQIAEQARFENAIQQGESLDSLALFSNYCLNGKFIPKSCENAKVLSIKLNQHPKLIAIVEHLVIKDASLIPELIEHYEEGGYFTQSAEMMGKVSSNQFEFRAQLKKAILYEVGRNSIGRDFVLKQITQALISRKMKITAPEEKAILSFLSDTRLLNPNLLSVVQDSESKAFLAEKLEEQNQGNKLTLQILLSLTDYQGVAWASKVIEKANVLSNEEAKIKFYGRNGQVAFQKRVNRLKELNQFSDKYLNGCDALTRTKLLGIVLTSHERIADEIMASPLPATLTEEQAAQIKVSLVEMAKPFQDKALSLKTLLNVEEQKVSVTQSSAVSPFDEQQYQLAINQLHQNPKNAPALTQLSSLFANAGLTRQAAYFKGRIQGL